MNKTRWALGFAAIVVGLGVLVGALAWMASRGVEAQSSESSLALDWVPRSADIVGQLDVTALASSPLAESFTGNDSAGPPKDNLPVPDELREATGIDWKKDVGLFTFSSRAVDGSAADAGRERWGVVLQGSFDPADLVQRLGEHQSDLAEETYRGTKVYRLGSVRDREGESRMALAIPDASTVLVGHADYVREMLDAGGGTIESVRSAVESWGFGSFDGQTFWVAGAPTDLLGAITGQPGQAGPAGADGPAGLASNLRAFALSGRLDDELALRARGRATDSQAAKEIADVLTGLVALGKLQGGRGSTSELAALADAVQIDQLDAEIHVNLSVPYETVEKLLSTQRRRAQASP